jgi:hypothetical protein
MRLKARYLVSIAAVAVAVIALAPAASANCGVAKGFGQFSAPNYSYTFMPTTSNNTSTTIIGKFWEVGSSSTDSSGAGCDDSYWFRPCPATYSCGGNPTGKTRYILGFMGGAGCNVVGCPGGGDLNTLIQDTATDGKTFFALARVSEINGPLIAYDYTRVGANITLVQMARPTVTSSSRAGTTINLNMTLNPVQTGFYGLSGQTAQGPGNISGYRLYTFTGTADPGRARGSYVQDATQRPYTGAAVTVTNFPVNCSNTAQDVFVALGLEFDGGAVQSDYVSQSFRVECDPTIADPKNFRTLDKPAGVKTAPPRR